MAMLSHTYCGHDDHLKSRTYSGHIVCRKDRGVLYSPTCSMNNDECVWEVQVLATAVGNKIRYRDYSILSAPIHRHRCIWQSHRFFQMQCGSR